MSPRRRPAPPPVEAPEVVLEHPDFQHAHDVAVAREKARADALARLLRAGLQGLGVIAALGALATYPVLVWRDHQTPAAVEAALPASTNWRLEQVAVLIAMVKHAREVEGWRQAAPAWTPRARLAADRARQTEAVRAIGDFAGFLSGLHAGQGGAQPDLASAARLLRDAADTVDAEGALAAAEAALQAFDTRAARREVEVAALPTDLVAQAALFADWMRTASERVGGPPIPGLAGAEAFAAGRARAEVARRLLQATRADYAGLLRAPGRAGALDAGLAALAVAGDFDPPLVLELADDNPTGAGHRAALAWRLHQAAAALSVLGTTLAEAPDASTVAVTEAHDG
jgi:hypothetical protein